MAIARDVTRAIMITAKVNEDAVSVAIEEFEPRDWAEKVYRPDITSNPDIIYKKPGYTM